MPKMDSSLIQIVYCSWSAYKKEEWDAVRASHSLPSDPDHKLGERFKIDFRPVPTKEPLLCDLEKMVRHKVLSAYQGARIPCIVEHAGFMPIPFVAAKI